MPLSQAVDPQAHRSISIARALAQASGVEVMVANLGDVNAMATVVNRARDIGNADWIVPRNDNKTFGQKVDGPIHTVQLSRSAVVATSRAKLRVKKTASAPVAFLRLRKSNG